MKIQEQIIFPNFFYTVEIEDVNNLVLQDFILDLEKKNSGRICSNAGGWQEEIISHNNIELSKLLDQTTSICQEVANTWKLDKKISIKNAWANINRKDNFNYPHFHPKALFSGVYYVKAEENSGSLILKRPDIQEHYVDELNSEYTQKNFGFVPKQGTFVLFPSYINHYVEQNLSTKERISIAINFDS